MQKDLCNTTEPSGLQEAASVQDLGLEGGYTNTWKRDLGTFRFHEGLNALSNLIQQVISMPNAATLAKLASL